MKANVKFYFVMLGIVVTSSLSAQKNVITISSSPSTGIQLPPGTKQDKRLLSTTAAAMLLEEEAKTFGVKINTAEVLQLPVVNISGWGRNQFEESIRASGWAIFPVQSNAAYGWLQRKQEYLFYYYAEHKDRTDLYFGQPDGVPAIQTSDYSPPSENKSPAVQASDENSTKNISSTSNLPPVQTNNSVSKPASVSSIIGTWYKSSSIRGNTAYGYVKCQYLLQADGTYMFYRKTFDVYTPQLVLRKERGTYVVKENALVITPTHSVIQTWNKKDGSDQWGNLIKSETVALENISYQLKFHSFGDSPTMLLSPINGEQTNRDGPFGINSEFPNTYFYERPPSPAYLIDLPTDEGDQSQQSVSKQTVKHTNSGSGGLKYTFSTTNWDDGWISTIEDDKVVVTKGGLRVHVYFSIPYDDASRHAGRDYYWDHYVTKQFRILSKRYRDHGEVISSFQAPYIEGTAIDPLTGKNCFLALYVSSSNGLMFPVLAVAPDEQAIRTTFPKAEAQYESDLAAMDRYNRFAVALPDLIGKWGGSTSSAQNYYNVYTGAYAGMAAVAMSDSFQFFVNGDYSSKHQGASGMVGSMPTYSQQYNGKATISNWSAVLTNRWEGKTEEYDVWFTAVKGGRVLNLQRKLASGLSYNLVREN